MQRIHQMQPWLAPSKNQKQNDVRRSCNSYLISIALPLQLLESMHTTFELVLVAVKTSIQYMVFVVLWLNADWDFIFLVPRGSPGVLVWQCAECRLSFAVSKLTGTSTSPSTHPSLAPRALAPSVTNVDLTHLVSLKSLPKLSWFKQLWEKFKLGSDWLTDCQTIQGND